MHCFNFSLFSYYQIMSHFNKHTQPLFTAFTRNIINLNESKEYKNEKNLMN